MEPGGHGTCIVIGVGPKLGFSVVRRFAASGHPVAMMARRREALEAFGARLAEDVRWGAYPVDAARSDQVAAVVRRAQADLGPADVLVYNAALLGLRAWPTALSHEDLMASIEVDVGSALAAVQAVVPAMRAFGRGTILFTSGNWGIRPSGEYCAVGLGKAALHSLGLSLAEELAPERIQVTTVTIGGVIRPESDYTYDPDRLAELYWDLHSRPPAKWEPDIRY